MIDRRTFIGAVGAALASPTLGAQADTPRTARAEAFRVDIPQDRLDDLRARLIRTRFAKTAGEGWEYGADSQWLQATVADWANGFNWRDQERRINRFPTTSQRSMAVWSTSSTSQGRVVIRCR